MTTELLDTATPTSDAGSQDATPPANTTPAAGQGAQATAGADNPPAADATATGDKPDGDGKPTDYEPFQLPEGVTADEELLGEFKATAKELGLSQEGAQKLASLQVKAFAKQQEAMATTRTQWAEQSKTDKEFGGEALQENLGVAKKALDAFASPDLRKLLNESGLGNHPEVIRHFVRVGKAISEDGRVVSGSKAVTPSDPAKRLFPNQS
jgi:hypothetical protein